MRQIDNLSDDSNPETEVVLDDGSTARFEFFFRAAAQVWTFNVTWGNFSKNGLILVQHPNALRAWRATLPFGLACTAKDGVDPIYAEDFSTARVSLFVLNQAEVAQIETNLFEVTA